MVLSVRATAALTITLAAPVVGAMAGSSCTTFDGVTVAGDAAASDTTLDVAVDTRSSEAGSDAPDAATRQGYLSLDDAARVCSMVFKCQELAPSVLVSVAVPVDPINYSLCVHWLAAPMPPDRPGLAVQAQTFECIAQSTTCDAASACLSEELIVPTDPRCADAGTDGGERCGNDGGTVENCAGGYLLHCGAAYYATGSHCLVGQDGARWCALDTNCTVSDSCIGTINDFCGDNVHESVNCAFDGYTCDVATNDDSGTANCNTGTQFVGCSTEGTSCSGSTVDVCDGFQVSEFDCAALGETCLSAAGPAICGTSKDPCTPFDTGVNTCSGTSISLCVGGRPQQVDCSSIGMGCIAGAGAQSGHCG